MLMNTCLNVACLRTWIWEARTTRGAAPRALVLVGALAAGSAGGHLRGARVLVCPMQICQRWTKACIRTFSLLDLPLGCPKRFVTPCDDTVTLELFQGHSVTTGCHKAYSKAQYRVRTYRTVLLN